MIHVVPLALVLCCLASPAAAAPVAAQAVTRLEWPGGLSVRCGVPLGPADLLLRFDAGPAGPVRFAAGLDSPWVRVGPLLPAGLLRVAADPLGFGPGSDVADEPTGLRLDGSRSGPDGFSVQVAPVPETLSLFWLRPDGGTGVLGATVGIAGPIVMEAVATLSESNTDVPGQGWFSDRAPTPAGLVLHGATRLGVSMPVLAATVSGGVSAAERAPPGWFVLGTAAVGRGDAGVDLIAACASTAYLELGEGGRAGGVRAGVRLRLAASNASIHVRYVLSVGTPGFVPGPFLPSEEDLAFVAERRWPREVGAWEAGLSLANRIAIAADGGRTDDPSGKLSAGWDSTCLDAEVAVDVDRDEGVEAGISVSATDGGGSWRTGGEVRCAWGGGDPVSVSVTGHVRLEGGDGEVLLRAGFRSLRLGWDGPDDAAPWASLEWRVTDQGRGAPADRAP